MPAADAALLAVALACQALRGIGIVLAGRLRPDHAFIQWAAAVAQATLAAFVVLATVAPSGALASVPLPARLCGAATALGVLLIPGGDRVLLALLAGLAATLLVWQALA